VDGRILRLRPERIHVRHETVSHNDASYRYVMRRVRPERRRVISVGGDSNLLSIRHAILELGGYEVWSTTNLSLASSFIRHERCGVLLLCYSLRDNWRKTLIKLFRESCPRGRIVGVVKRANPYRSKGVDEVVFDSDGGKMLLKTIARGSEREVG
jgi:hypothetical protein